MITAIADKRDKPESCTFRKCKQKTLCYWWVILSSNYV